MIGGVEDVDAAVPLPLPPQATIATAETLVKSAVEIFDLNENCFIFVTFFYMFE